MRFNLIFDLFWLCKSIFLYAFVAYSILKDKHNHCFLVPDFEKIQFVVRRSLEPFKDLDGRFDPSSTALTKRSPTVLVFLVF